MAGYRWRYGRKDAGRPAAVRAPAGLVLAVALASCVPALGDGPPAAPLLLPDAPAPLALIDAAPPLAQPAETPATDAGPGLAALPAGAAERANALLPISGLPNPAATPALLRAAAMADRLRALDCLAEAVYYEARSESSDGQRAVAQVVLNRVRHPAWPNSVCGVVYQGPMRAGGGCQFTFTCDGSLARAPAGPAWAQARAIAAAALAGAVYAPVGHSTHYHTQAVFPAWAPRLAKTAVIGAHSFYRLPGAWGGPGAFTARYAASEPLPRPAMTVPAATSLPAWAEAAAAAAPSAPTERPARTTVAAAEPAPAVPLVPSTVREEYRNAGQWRSDAPAAVTGAR
jgi:spore germination cell wall hydrolase CwlJ-like protein